MRVSSEAYLRKFWWFASIYPLFGAGLLLLTSDPLMRYVGVIALLWPFTIPLRSVYTLAKTGRVRGEIQVGVEDGELLFLGEEGRETRRPVDTIRSITRAAGTLLLYTSPTSYFVVPMSAFESTKDARDFEDQLRKRE